MPERFRAHPAHLFGAAYRLLLAGCLVVPSSGTVIKYGGNGGWVLYVAAVLLVLFLGERWVRPWMRKHLSHRAALLLGIAAVLLVTAAVVVVYPIADSGAVGGGSDRDDALDVSVGELVEGRYPYHARTYLGRPISPLPGAILLAAPFVGLFGTSAYQNLFWFTAFFLLVQRRLVKDSRDSLLLALLVLGLSPGVWQELATGGDLLANSLYVTTAVLLMITVHGSEELKTWQAGAADVFFGIALASRANFLLVLVPVAAYLIQRAGVRYAFRHTGLALAVTALLVLPFYFYDPAGFTPLQTVDELNLFAFISPHAGRVLGGLAVLSALILALRKVHLTLRSVLLHCALPQAVPVVLGVIALAFAPRPNYGYASFGLSFLFFAAVGAWLGLHGGVAERQE